MLNKRILKWFTLIEIMIWILIISIVIVWWFQALSSVNIWKAKLMSSVELQKQIIYFEEKLFEEIKKWWLIDYEEYFNRSVIWTGFSSGHYIIESWFWNFWKDWAIWSTTYWDWFYKCISESWSKMWNWGCVEENNDPTQDYSLENQRYWEYSFQFIDYNANYDDDWWDEDWDWEIIWDDDDEYIWDWPEVFTSWTDVKELYLISWDKKTRTYFRWNIESDPNAPSTFSCNSDWTWSWCLWTIEFLKLEWKDYGLDHLSWSVDEGQYDWVIDTWIIDKNFTSWTEIVAWSISNMDDYWVPLFSDDINISDFQVYLYPNKDYDLAWKSLDDNVNLSPYTRIKLSIWPSWKVKNKVRWDVSDIEFSTTISLTDIFSK